LRFKHPKEAKMMRILVCSGLALVLSFAISAQSDSTPRFEAADIHPSAPSTNIRDNFVQGPFAGGGGRFEIRKATMLDLVRLGGSFQRDKIVGGPSWADVDRFDILAKGPAGASSADLRMMLQNLLADRFNLKTHKDTKPMPAHALVVAPGKK